MELVTGGAGFIGSHIVRRLHAEGRPVRSFDLHRGILPAGVDIVEGDVRDRALLARATQGVEVIYHLAAEPSVQRSIADPYACLDINVTGTLNLLLAARDAGVRRVVFASSCAVYGDDPVMPKQEAMALTPRSPYAASKAMGEHLCQVAGAVYGVEAVALRYFNVYGPGQRPDSAYAAVIPRFIDALLKQKQPVIFGDGEQTRDFVFVGDIVNANLAAATAPGVAGSVFNIASGESTSLNRLLATICSLLGVEPNPHREPERPGDIRFSEADISQAMEKLGYAPRTILSEGLRQTVAAFAGA